MWQELQNTLCDFSFIEAKCAAGLVYDLLADYDAAIHSKGLSNEQRGVISGFSRFVRAHAHLLATHPGLALQQALNEPDSGIVQKRAAAVAVAAPSPYFRHLNKPQTASACVLTLFGHSEIVSTCNFSPDGNKIVSGAGDGEIRIWDAESGQLLIAFRNHDASVEYCCFCSDRSLVFSAMRDGVMQFSDAKNGRLVRTLPGEGAVPVCRLTKDNRRMIRASWDGTVTMWDLDATGLSGPINTPSRSTRATSRRTRSPSLQELPMAFSESGTWKPANCGPNGKPTPRRSWIVGSRPTASSCSQPPRIPR